ncbi:hypothetical protein [Actinoplanes teichomyceticus]|uniref:Uncharacterized protein n=1 Tax=Actinoplanes teichomyceticus TaxID=1867 RepID=A0A561WB51_ACTTI|nr:hypothetical protein [Actinoplanes teichomyceticus]TWG21081.1 hypothetical protein FHX34_103611 [Actinoplanes teichomyceticus]GIF14901.1 hypothetical protein Ate01nite_49330 [Actinoplanes teichomyceticus]
MALTPCTDLSAARWLVDDDQPWARLVTTGPAGFPAYARLRFLPDPAYPGQHEADVVTDDDAPAEAEQLRTALTALAGHTTTPGDCYFCVWEGWGRWLTEVFPAEVLAGPKVEVPGRAFHLFRGPLADFGPEAATAGWPDPAFVWPADRAWCVADDVDPHWAGIGGSEAAIAELLTTPGIDVVRTTPDEAVPFYR